ncbi:MFS transporter [Bradyrhizobium septentrionale]|uniref:MFS transporter n=1 Tax=Bradyrhizobium septentrionale TaxID=1404411 RepID=UPI001CCDDE2A|nr:MFS transporter [Bradyrhizobium septentrionale]
MRRPANRARLATAFFAVQPIRPASSAGRLPSAAIAFAIFVSSAARVLPALLAVSIQKDLGWQISDVAWPITFGIAVSASASPLATRGLERWGVRWPLVVSLVLLAVSLASTTLATSPGHLVLAWGLGLGCSGSLSASILGAMVGSRRSAAHCGTRFGLLTSMQFLGSAAGLLLASRAVEAFGWRIAFHAAAVVVLTTAFVVVLLVPASGREVTPQQSASSRHAPSYPEGRGWRFWALAAIFCICGASTSGLIDSQLSILCMGAGLGLSSSADVMAIFLLGGAIGSVASGYLADRYPARMLLAGYFVARALILLWLPFTGLSVVELARFGALYGLDAALTFPALVILMSANLGSHGIGAAMGWMMAAHVAGATIASAGVVALGLAGYAIGFASVGLTCLVAAGLAVLLKDPPSNEEPFR